MTSEFSTHFHQREPYQASCPFIDGLQKPQQTADLLAFLEIPGGFNSRRLHQLDPPCRLGGLGPAPVGAAVLCGTWASMTPTLPGLNLSHTPALPDTPTTGNASRGCIQHLVMQSTA